MEFLNPHDQLANSTVNITSSDTNIEALRLLMQE